MPIKPVLFLFLHLMAAYSWGMTLKVSGSWLTACTPGSALYPKLASEYGRIVPFYMNNIVIKHHPKTTANTI